VVYAEPGFPGAWKQAQARLKELLGRLRAPVSIPEDVRVPSAPAVSEFGEAEFKAAVRRAKQYIVDGDIMQVVLSQRMKKPFAASPMALYRALRTLNPSPYMFYFNFQDFHVVGASPEILVRLEDGDGERTVTVRPIAGTRKRGASPERDRELELELRSDPKELAEHLMLIDLGRNDIGRVCRYGSIRVPEYMVIERYSHVMHIVSQVEGKLRPDRNAFDVMRATFPAGTVSGAPKIRAMQLIAQFEKLQRGFYAGALGYFSYDGNLDSCITLRTALVKDGQITIQAGAGLVADSVPASEYQETINKASALLKAVAIADGA
jgi:anthranilate synthase component 1